VNLRRRLKHGAALLGRQLRTPIPGIRVLIYHRVGETRGLEIDLSLEAFTEQLCELKRRGPILSLAAAREAAAASQELEASVLTFDDGFQETFDCAVPLLRSLAVPAHFYLSTSNIVQGWIPTSGGRAPAVTPATISSLASDPLFTFGSHGHTHRVLTRLTEKEVEDELHRSSAMVEDWTGAPSEHFAYPKGLWDSRTECIVKKSFQTAAIVGSRPLRPRGNPFRIPRYPIQASDDVYLFNAKLDGALFLEDAARSARNRMRSVLGRVPEQ
jgi:peptidoglycan/xylan/chitin deacetylase (PgdA/CDA1 family)